MITLTTDDGNRTVTLEYTALKTKVDPTLDQAARWLYVVKGRYHINGKTYAELTLSEKLRIIDYAVRDTILSWAKSHYTSTALLTDKAIRDGEADEDYAL